MEPPNTPEEQAELEQAIAAMLEGREATHRSLAFSQFIGRLLDPAVAPSRDDDTDEH